MSFPLSHLRYVAEVLQQEAVGSRLGKLSESTRTDFLLAFGKVREKRLLISLRPSEPLALFTEMDGSFASLSSSFFIQLRKELDHAYLENVEIWNDDRILALTLLCTSETFRIQKRYLVCELIVGQANMFLLDERKTILMLYKSSAVQGRRLLLKGVPYEYPNQHQAWQSNQEMTPFDMKQAFQVLQQSFEAKKRHDRHELLLKTIRQHLKSSTKKLINQEKDYQAALGGDAFKEEADLLLTYLDDIPLHQEEVELDGHLIQIDPRLTPKEQAVQFYKRYQKAKSALKHLDEQKAKTEEEIRYFTLLNEQWQSADERDLCEMEEELSSLGYLPSPPRKKTPAKKTYQPYFITYDGVRIGYGKNNLQNDYLSFHLASKKDCFLHVKDHPGSHVIIFHPHPENHVLRFAAMLALRLAHLEDGEVIYTTVSELEKLKQRGLVKLRHYQTLYLSQIDHSLLPF